MFAGQDAKLPGGGGAVELGLGLFLSPNLTPAVTAAVLLAWRGFTYYGALLVGAPLIVWAMGSLRPDTGRLALLEFAPLFVWAMDNKQPNTNKHKQHKNKQR